MNIKTIIPVGVAVILGVIAVKVGKDMVSHNQVAAPAAAATVKVVTANADVPAGVALKETDLTIGSLPAASVPAGIYNTPSEVVGRVPQVALVKGQTILDTLLASKGVRDGLVGLIPDGMRAVTLEVNDVSGVAGMLAPGCEVDLVATIGGEGNKGSTARTIVEDLKIVAVGKRLNNSPPPDGDQNQGNARAITLIATPRDVQIIELASHMGSPRLVLRGSLDKTHVGGAGVTIAELRGKREDTDAYAGALNAMLTGSTTNPSTNPSQSEDGAARSYQVEVIRNGTVQSTRLPLPPRRVISGENIADQHKELAPVIGGN